MFVSHLSSFLFYLYVSASVQRKNRLARDKSFLAIPTMPWFNWKKWFVLRQATKHSHNHGRRRRKCPPNAPHKALRLIPTCQIDGQRSPEQEDVMGVEGVYGPQSASLFRRGCIDVTSECDEGHAPPQPLNNCVRLLRGFSPIEQRR
jgi:hypothetical protein